MSQISIHLVLAHHKTLPGTGSALPVVLPASTDGALRKSAKAFRRLGRPVARGCNSKADQLWAVAYQCVERLWQLVRGSIANLWT